MNGLTIEEFINMTNAIHRRRWKAGGRDVSLCAVFCPSPFPISPALLPVTMMSSSVPVPSSSFPLPAWHWFQQRRAHPPLDFVLTTHCLDSGFLLSFKVLPQEFLPLPGPLLKFLLSSKTQLRQHPGDKAWLTSETICTFYLSSFVTFLDSLWDTVLFFFFFLISRSPLSRSLLIRPCYVAVAILELLQSCLCLPNAEIMGMLHHGHLPFRDLVLIIRFAPPVFTP